MNDRELGRLADIVSAAFHESGERRYKLENMIISYLTRCHRLTCDRCFERLGGGDKFNRLGGNRVRHLNCGDPICYPAGYLASPRIPFQK